MEPFVHDSTKPSMHLTILNALFKNFIHTALEHTRCISNRKCAGESEIERID